MKKSLVTLGKLAIIIGLSSGVAYAESGFKEHFNLGQSYLTQYQYPQAIEEFKSALRINYMDISARIGLINAYLANANEYANNDRNWEKAANDFRSALFYMKYYPNSDSSHNITSNIPQVENNLEQCLNYMGFDFSPQNRFNIAKKLQAAGNLQAAAYEYNQTLGDKNLQKISLERTGDIMMTLGNKPKAAEFYKRALFVAPTDLNLRLTYAKTLDILESDDLALKEYGYVLSKVTEDNKDVLYTLEKTFSKKVESHPNNANFNANMGAVLQKQGNFDDALKYYRQAAVLDPSNINTRLNTGTLYQQKGDYRTAIKAYESILIVDPKNINANLYRAQCYDKLGETKIAQEAFKKVAELDPSNSFLKAHMIENAKKTMTVEEFVQYVNTNMADNSLGEILYDYALELHKKGKTAESITLYRYAIKANPNNAEQYVNLALAQAQGNLYEEALKTIKIAQNKFPNNNTIADTYKNLKSMQTDNLLDKAKEAYNQKDYQTAIKYYLSINPPTVATVLGIATSYQEMGDTDRAIEHYKKALELKPIDSDIAYAIACLYGEKEDYENTKVYLQKSIAFNKNNTQAIEYLQSLEEMNRANQLNDAIALYEADKIDESFVIFNEILSADGNNAYALYYRGMIYDTKQKRNEAIADMKKAYSLNNEFTICNYLIASEYDALGKYKEAYNYYLAYADSEVQDDEYKQYAKARAEELKEYASK